MNKPKLYKFLRTNLKSENGRIKWQFGQWQKFEGKLEMCKSGFHCSLEPYDAFSYVRGEILAEVEVRGESIKQDDKQVWSEMRVLKAWKWNKFEDIFINRSAAGSVARLEAGSTWSADSTWSVELEAILKIKQDFKKIVEQLEPYKKGNWAK